MKQILLSPSEERIVDKLINLLKEYDNEISLSLLEIDGYFQETKDIINLYYLLEEYYETNRYSKFSLIKKPFEYKGIIYEVYEIKSSKTKEIILRKSITSELEDLNILNILI